MQRATRSRGGVLQPSNVNKPFKSPVIRDTAKESSAGDTKPKKKEQTFIPLLEDDIIDSDEDDIAALDTRRDSPELFTSKSSLLPTKRDEIEDDELEEIQASSRPFAGRQGFGNARRGKFTKRVDREMNQNTERRKAELEETKGDEPQAPTENPYGKLKKYPGQDLLIKNLARIEGKTADQVLAEMKSPPKKKPDQLDLSRYSHIMQKNKITFDPKLLELLSDNLKEDDDSDSGASTSSGKRKRETSSSPDNPINLDDDDAPAKPKKSKKSKKSKRKGDYRCPVCDEQVSQALYDSYMPDLPNDTDLKRKLHRSHKLEKAHAKKKELGIPDIEWDELKDRCVKYIPYLQKIMEKKTSSHYRTVSEKFNRKKRTNGRSRTEQILENGNWEKEFPGYYGARGQTIMADVVTGSKILVAALERLRRSRDVTIDSCGRAGYIQGILVPELATRIIMEDFKMADDKIEEGRKMMIDTIDIGRLLNDDPNDSQPGDGEGDGMGWWHREKHAREQAELLGEDTEPENSQASIYVDAD
ncbi:hypothetical protein ABW21_db0200319 [Orbilia brochopaga]|nr:hypothetical protein ABW21_db0200319 [Drechslerella brochopaga]